MSVALKKFQMEVQRHPRTWISVWLVMFCSAVFYIALNLSQPVPIGASLSSNPILLINSLIHPFRKSSGIFLVSMAASIAFMLFKFVSILGREE